MTGLVRGWSRLYHGETDIDFVGRRNLWFVISGIVLALSIGSLAIRGLNFGIEFKGGIQISAPIPESGPVSHQSGTRIVGEVRGVAGKLGAPNSLVQVETDPRTQQRTVLVQTEEIANPKAQNQLAAAVAKTVGTTVGQTSSERIGSTWGGEITSKAIKALVIFMLAIVAFISWRFEWKMALAAFAALIHDLVITAGVYSLVGFQVTPSTVVAILTILGYSLYDTVVVFDKVEENTARYAVTGRLTYRAAANLSMNQVFMRSLNTSLSTLLPVAALLFVGAGLLGASTLEDLALALLVGILSGTYSSIFVATPVLTIMKEREPHYRGIQQKLLREAQRAAGQRPLVQRTGAAREPREELEQEPEPVAERVGAGVVSRPSAPAVTGPKGQAKGRVGSKKAKRRKRR
jgi:preprotein translocase subunit SecF